MMRLAVNHLLRVSALLGVSVLAAGATAQVTTIEPFEASYKVRFKGLGGEMTQSLTRDEQRFEARSMLKPKGLASVFARGRLEETSRFFVEDTRVVADEYAMTDTIAKNDKSGSLRFDWGTSRARGDTEDGPVEHPIDSATYDRSSIQYALMLDLLNGRMPTQYTMLDGDRRKTLTITHLGESVLEVPYGKFSVNAVSHQSEGSRRRTTLYFAPVLGFVPVQIEQFKDDKLQVRAQLKRHRKL